MSLWDTAGSESYDSLRPMSYPGTSVFLICYNVVSRASFDNVVARWVPECRRFSSSVCPFVLVATKTDLRNEAETLGRLHAMGQTPVSTEEGIAMAKSIGCDAYVETSALTGEGIQSVFNIATHVALETLTGPRDDKSRRGQKCVLQ